MKARGKFNYFANQAPDAAPNKGTHGLEEQLAPNAPVGKQYDATQTLRRLKYLENILMTATLSDALKQEARAEKLKILERVDD